MSARICAHGRHHIGLINLANMLFFQCALLTSTAPLAAITPFATGNGRARAGFRKLALRNRFGSHKEPARGEPDDLYLLRPPGAHLLTCAVELDVSACSLRCDQPTELSFRSTDHLACRRSWSESKVSPSQRTLARSNSSSERILLAGGPHRCLLICMCRSYHKSFLASLASLPTELTSLTRSPRRLTWCQVSTQAVAGGFPTGPKNKSVRSGRSLP